MRTTLSVLLCSTFLTPALFAQGQGQTAAAGKPEWLRESGNPGRDARNFRRIRVDGETVAANVTKLRKELRWHKTVSGALKTARSNGKPVVWIQALGDLDGFL